MKRGGERAVGRALVRETVRPKVRETVRPKVRQFAQAGWGKMGRRDLEHEENRKLKKEELRSVAAV